MAGNIFNKIQLGKPRYSHFDLSHDHKLSCKMGYLVPVTTIECVPGDRISMSSEAMFRMMPMIAPIMHKVDVFIHCFFVPNRILWEGWETWITGSNQGQLDISPPAFPTLDPTTLGSVLPSSLANYMGLPVGVDLGAGFPDGLSAMRFSGYQKIWYDWYRDENLIGPNEWEPLVDGAQNSAQTGKLLQIRKRAWEHDYFTSCLPFAQKGAAVSMPIDILNPMEVSFQPGSDPIKVTDQTGSLVPGVDVQSSPTASLNDQSGGGGQDLYLDPNPGGTGQSSLVVDPDQVDIGATINDLRTAFSLQKWLEKNARAGSRYIESMLAHFNVRSSDNRLQRPEYLGGSRSSMAISEVLQTSATEAETPQGNMAGHGISVSDGKGFKYFCEEHGFVHCILSIRPRTAYYQGVPKDFMKTVDNTEYIWPDFAQLGEQAVKSGELVATVIPAINQETFGYIPRYSEYRYLPSRVSGQMADTLEFWHMARKFDPAAVPVLSSEFIECDPTKRIFAVDDPDEDEIVAHIYHKIMARRPLPLYGNPGGL